MADDGASDAPIETAHHAPAPRHSHIRFPVTSSISRPGSVDAETSKLWRSQISDQRRPSLSGVAPVERTRSTTMPSMGLDSRTAISSANVRLDKGRTSLDLHVAPHAFSDEYDLCELCLRYYCVRADAFVAQEGGDIMPRHRISHIPSFRSQSFPRCSTCHEN
jgi:hypothetical protein